MTLKIANLRNYIKILTMFKIDYRLNKYSTKLYSNVLRYNHNQLNINYTIYSFEEIFVHRIMFIQRIFYNVIKINKMYGFSVVNFPRWFIHII